MVLSSIDDFEVLDQANDGAEVLSMVETFKPDVALLDFSMPNMSGLEATRRIEEVCPRTRVIILSIHEHRHYALRALQAGAMGYMHKGAPPDAIIEAIRKVHAGNRGLRRH